MFSIGGLSVGDHGLWVDVFFWDIFKILSHRWIHSGARVLTPIFFEIMLQNWTRDEDRFFDMVKTYLVLRLPGSQWRKFQSLPLVELLEVSGQLREHRASWGFIWFSHRETEGLEQLICLDHNLTEGDQNPNILISQARIFELWYQHNVPSLPFRNVFTWTHKGHGSSEDFSEVSHYQSTLISIFHSPDFLIREQAFSGKELHMSCPLTSSTISSV